MKRQKFSRSRVVSTLSALLLPLVIFGGASAQTGTSSVRGTVSDPQGNVIAGANVTLINTETNATRNSTASDNGLYAFELIQPGTYRIEAEASGFSPARRRRIILPTISRGSRVIIRRSSAPTSA